jgi:outer membrane cobalamin receptor
MTRKIALLCLVLFSIVGLASAQHVVKGMLVDSETQEPIIGATVVNAATKTGDVSQLDGSFQLTFIGGDLTLDISYLGYTPVTKKLTVKGNVDLGVIAMTSDAIGLGDVTVTASVAIRRKTPVALSTIEPATLEVKMTNQEFPEILKMTPGVYATKQGGAYGDSRINLRGFESANIAVMVNGVPVNDMEWGGVYWSNWAGLSDVTKSMQVQRGLGASKIASPSVGGSINIVTKSTDAKRGGTVYYGLGNDGYLKQGISFSTGLSENGWAATFLGSKTTGNGYIQGTDFEAYTWFVNLSKVLDNHTLSFTGFGSPQWHNQRNYNNYLTIAEWQKQPLGYKYNPAFGYDMNGQAKTSNRNEYHKPQLSLNHYWTIDDVSSLSSVVYVSIGNGSGYSGQGYTSDDRSSWYGASSGLPNNLFRRPDGAFDYGAIYALNQDPDNLNGAKMVMSQSVNQHRWVGLLSTYTRQLDQLEFSGGVDVRYYKGIHTNVINDMYGGSFFIDQTNRPNLTSTDWKTRKLGLGDVVYRDYDGFVFSQGVFGQAEYTDGPLTAFVSGSLSNTSYWRYDRFYYDEADARSETVNYLGFTLKGGANYNLDEHHNVFANVGYISRAPFFSGGVFLQAATSNITNPNGVNEKSFSFELGYGYRSRYLTANVNVYRTSWLDKTMVISQDASSYEALVLNMEGVNALHQGVEVDLVSKPLKGLELTGMLSIGDWRWTNNASGYLYTRQGQPVDKNGNEVALLSPEHYRMKVNLKGIRVGNSAQTTAALGANYEWLKGFKTGLDYVYWGRNYSYYKLNDVSTTLSPETTYKQPWMIPAAGVFDFYASYRFKLGDFNCLLNGKIDNVFDQTYIADAADGDDHTWKTAKVFYGFGRTWSMGLKLMF